jgi:hypothetical protein
MLTVGCATGSGPSVNLIAASKEPYYVDRIKVSFVTQPGTPTLLPKFTGALKEIDRVPAPEGRPATLVVQLTEFYDTGGAQSLLIGGSNWIACSVWLRDGKSDKPVYQTSLREWNGYALGGIIAAIVEADSDDETALSHAMAARIQRDVLDLHNIRIAHAAVIEVDTPTVQEVLQPASLPVEADTATPSGKPETPPLTRLSALRAATASNRPKLSAFSTLPDGPLDATLVKALFEGLEVMAEESEAPMFYNFTGNGRMNGQALGRPPRGNNDDIGTWRVTSSGELCMKWLNWESGSEHCYGIAKRRDRISLRPRSRPRVIEYQIQN